MSELKIDIGPTSGFSPGDILKGRASWFSDEPLTSLELRLFWYTQGKGTQDVAIVETETFTNLGRQGERDFQFTLPSSPYSCSGKLLSIVWALELISQPGDVTTRHGLTIAPGGTERIINTGSGVQP